MHRSSPGVPDTGKTGNRPVGNGLKMSRFGGHIGGPGFRGSSLTDIKFRSGPMFGDVENSNKSARRIVTT